MIAQGRGHEAVRLFNDRSVRPDLGSGVNVGPFDRVNTGLGPQGPVNLGPNAPAQYYMDKYPK